ncbi:MAG: hypothetical protein KZQ85_05095 [Candidatus Thiodiazotropha sp. (ex Myrtea sp. 'scaly one' KF741663)]|nr:hypothetical protein [Candidatus Thiodiazotropha sp. (ex Myrtea sp. 'scaly one' KF741663)]
MSEKVVSDNGGDVEQALAEALVLTDGPKLKQLRKQKPYPCETAAKLFGQTLPSPKHPLYNAHCPL